MSTTYESAKRIALGLASQLKDILGEDLWNISLGDVGPTAEMPYQFFEKGFEPPEELVLQKSALMLFDSEYEADAKAAQQRFEALKAALEASDVRALERLFAAAEPAQWLSLIFLDGGMIKDELVPLLENADSECKSTVKAALDKSLAKLVDFKALLESLCTCC